MSTATRTLYVAEPPAQFLLLPPLVVDCSTLAGLVFNESWHEQALRRIEGRSLNAPYLLEIEMTSVALKKHRRGFPDLASSGMQHYATMDIKLHPVKPDAVLILAIRYQLSAYDATYLWLATELKAPLATFDEKLATAAQAHLATLS